jgi:MFS family permease
MVPRVEVRTLASWGLPTLTVGIVAVALTLFEETPVGWAAVAWGVAGLGIGVTYPCFSLTVLRTAPRGGEGQASAAMKLNEVLGAALGTGLMGALVAAGEAGGWQTEALAIGFGLMALAGVAGLLVAQRLPLANEVPAEALAGSS